MKISKLNANYYDLLRYNHFCYEKLTEAGYSPQGWDKEKDMVCIMKYKDPQKEWDIEGRKVYYFDEYIDAAENLIETTREDFDKEAFDLMGKLSTELTKEEYKIYLQRKEQKLL